MLRYIKGRATPQSSSGRHPSQYRGAYTVLVDFIHSCRQNGCTPLADDQFQELLRAVEALSPQGAAYRRKTVDRQLADIDERDRGVLTTLGIAPSHRHADFDDEDGDAVDFTRSSCSSMHPNASHFDSCMSSTPLMEGQETDLTDATHQTYNADDTDEEYDFPRTDSVRFCPRATRFVGKDVITLNATKILGSVDFNPRSYSSGTGRDADARDMRLLLHMFNRPFDLIDRYSINETRFLAWLGAIADQYTSTNSYHNWLHGLEVTQFCYFTLTQGAGGKFFNFQDILALLCACVAHDVAHPGYTAAYLVRTGHELALRYNDFSPIENMHAYRFFETLTRPKHDFLHRHQGFKTFRQKVIRAILATDLAEHFTFVDRFTTRVSTLSRDPMAKSTREDPEARAASKEERGLLLEAFIHVADLGPNCRPFESHIFTVKNLEEEWFSQGDQERRLGLPVSPNFDRHKDSAANIQHFFLERMVLPLLEPFNTFVTNEVAKGLKQNLLDNVAGWGAALRQHCQDRTKTAAQLSVILLSPEKLLKWGEGRDGPNAGSDW